VDAVLISIWDRQPCPWRLAMTVGCPRYGVTASPYLAGVEEPRRTQSSIIHVELTLEIPGTPIVRIAARIMMATHSAADATEP
jgi:hypothetical protein